MAFLEESQIQAIKLKDKCNLTLVNQKISNIETTHNKPLPSGTSSPFMVICDMPLEQDKKNIFDSNQPLLDKFCSSLGIDKKDVYITSIIKYFAPTYLISQIKEEGKEILHKEIFSVNPDVIFLIGDNTKKIFNRMFLDVNINKQVQKPSFILEIDEHHLKYESNVVCLSSYDDAPKEAVDLVNRIKINWKFVHLHCHNSLSLKDGVGSPASRVQWHVQNKKPAIATSNHGNISDWYKIYEGAHENKIKPILGIEAYFNRDAEKLQEVLSLETNEAKQIKKKLRFKNRHVTLFAKNESGYFNLMKIHNEAWTKRFYRVPIISPKTLSELKDGIICLSGCATGEQNRIIIDKYFLQSEDRKKEIDLLVQNKIKSMSTLMNTKNDARASEDEYLDDNDLNYFYSHSSDAKLNKAEYELFARDFIQKMDQERIENADKQIREIIDWWHGVFKDDYYLELMVIDYPPQRFINEELIKISHEKNIPIVITNDCHYLTKAESQIQQLQMLSDQEKTFEELKNDTEGKIWTIKSKEFYYKTVDELYSSWQSWCKSDIFSETEFWKAINNTISIVDKIETWEIDRSVKLPKLYDNGDQILLKKCVEGMKKYGLVGQKEYEERLKYELKVIRSKKYVDYFLIVEYLVSWVKKQYGRLAVGPGRGSAAGSLVNYLIGLTYVDPLKYNLLFARFLDPSRSDLPDIDQDIEPRYRNNLIQHMIDTYGSDKVCPIGTFGVLKCKSAILDASRVCGIDPQEVFAVTTKLLGLDETKSLEDIEIDFPFLKEFLDKYDNDITPLRFYINSIRGSQKAIGTHAAGVLISSNVLFDNIPLIRSKKTIVTGWIDGEDGRELSGLNYAKMDVLGLKNLEVIDDTIKLIKERKGIDIDVDKINLDDANIYQKTVNNNDNFGIFQYESGLAAQLIQKIQPDNFTELSDISALMRPGPLKMGIPDMYANRKFNQPDENGHVWSEKDIPECIRPILIDTYGLVIYQEQVMLIAEAIGGQTREETNKFRKLLIKYGKFSKDNPEYAKNIKKYHDKFITTASLPENLGSQKKAEDLWDLLANFASYGFNKSHSISYATVSTMEYWLKTYYPYEFSVALINNTDVKDKKKSGSTMAQYIASISRKGTKIIRPSINNSGAKFTLNNKNQIVWGLTAIKGVSNPVSEKILEARKVGPFCDMSDLLERVGKKYLNKRTAESLIWSGAFDDYIDGNGLKNRFDIHKYFFCVVRGEKKYEDPDEDKSQAFIIKKEMDLCKFSLTEMKLFNRKRKEESITKCLFEVENKGVYDIVAFIEKKEYKRSKNKKKFVSFTLRDDTAIIGGISYFYPFEDKPDDKDYEDITLEINVGDLVKFNIQHNDKGFKNIRSFRRI